MTKRDLITAGLVIYGLVLIGTALVYSPTYLQSAWVSPPTNIPARVWLVTSLCAIAVPLVLGLILVCKADRISALVAREDTALQALDFKRNAQWALAVGLAILGVYLVTSSVNGFLAEVARAYSYAAGYAFERGESAQEYRELVMQNLWVTEKAHIIEAALKLLIGGCIAYFAAPVSGFLTRNYGKQSS